MRKMRSLFRRLSRLGAKIGPKGRVEARFLTNKFFNTILACYWICFILVLGLLVDIPEPRPISNRTMFVFGFILVGITLVKFLWWSKCKVEVDYYYEGHRITPPRNDNEEDDPGERWKNSQPGEPTILIDEDEDEEGGEGEEEYRPTVCQTINPDKKRVIYGNGELDGRQIDDLTLSRANRNFLISLFPLPQPEPPERGNKTPEQ